MAEKGRAMLLNRSGLSGVLVVLTVLTGCGGGSGGSGGGTGNGGGGDQNPTTVTFTFKSPAPTSVAARVGAGAFTAKTLSAGVLTLSIPFGTSNFAVAYICPAVGSSTMEFIVQATTADGTSFKPTCPSAAAPGSTGTLTGSLDTSAIPGASLVNIVAANGTDSSSAIAQTNGTFSVTGPAGNDRVSVVVYSSTLINYAQTISLAAVRNFSSQSVPGALNGGDPVVFTTSDQLTQKPITYANLPAGYSAPSTEVLYLFNGAGGYFIANAATDQYPAVPAAAAQTGDIYDFIAMARNGSGGAVSVELTETSGGPMTFSFPTPWTYAGPVPAATPSFQFAYSGFSGKEGVSYIVALLWQPASTTQNVISVMATANAQAGSTSLAVPDLSVIPGFMAAPISGTSVAWSANIAQSNRGVLQGGSTSGFSTNIVQNSSVYVVP